MVVLVALDEAEHQVLDGYGTGATLAGTWPSGGGRHRALLLASPWHP